VEPGKLADLIAMAGDPLEDMHHLRQVVLVMKYGQVVVDQRRTSW
jgi:imidazolonepropionase-like amidohydrolase